MKCSRLALCLLALAGGCDRQNAAPPASATAIYGSSTISGQIRFVGVPPERRMIDTRSCQHGSVQQEETIVVDAAGGLRDVVVSLADSPASYGSTRPAAVLDQVDCRYVPHVLAVQVGQALTIRTSDDFLHNVHYTSDAGDDVNFGLPHAGNFKTFSFERPQLLRLNCNVHPWMNASVAVVAHPFFAITTADGLFEIARVPAGRHTLVAWHPLLGERTLNIDVARDGTTTATLDFGPPGTR